MKNEVPLIGAEIFIEPGQTPQEIDTWFKRLQENGMSVTRIRMFENYMHQTDGTWDYTLFDYAFESGDRYGVKIYANLFPATSFTDVGGFKFPRDEAHLKSIGEYIKNVVSHFRQFASLIGWVPINEPGSGSLPEEPFSTKKFKEWKNIESANAHRNRGYEQLGFDEERFLMHYETWFIKWLTNEIHRFDPGKSIHVNNHQIFENVAEYNFPEWRKFLSSLGGSAHASWHFGYFSRHQYAVAMSANSEILRSGAGDIPWMMTELQGGNNTYSGFEAMCPTKEEISQWLWTTIGTGSKGTIFWCLNPRMSGFEAGEWALLNFRNEPSDRMKAASLIAGIINENAALFADATVLESGINILYTRESLWIEKKLQTGGTFHEGRNKGGIMKSPLSYFEALSEMGIQSNFKEISEFDFSKNDYMGITLILSHQVSIPSRYWQCLEDFASRGGKLIIDGLTAYYDENAVCILKDFPFQKLFGATILEFKMNGNLFNIILSDPDLTLQAHLWRGSIRLITATEIGREDEEIVASKNKFGEGEVFWVPSLLGLAARITKNYGLLSVMLDYEAAGSISSVPIRFKTPQKRMLMKILKLGSSFLTVIINKSEQNANVELNIINSITNNPAVLFADKKGSISDKIVRISSEETMVIQWLK